MIDNNMMIPGNGFNGQNPVLDKVLLGGEQGLTAIGPVVLDVFLAFGGLRVLLEGFHNGGPCVNVSGVRDHERIGVVVILVEGRDKRFLC